MFVMKHVVMPGPISKQLRTAVDGNQSLEHNLVCQKLYNVDVLRVSKVTRSNELSWT